MVVFVVVVVGGLGVVVVVVGDSVVVVLGFDVVDGKMNRSGTEDDEAKAGSNE